MMKQGVVGSREGTPDSNHGVRDSSDDSTPFPDLGGPAERLQDVLAQFRENVDGVRGIALADKSGLPVSASFPTRANILTLTAMATMAVQSSLRVFQNLALDGPSEVLMSGSDSTVFVYSVPETQLSLIVVLETFANLPLVRLEVERLGREISEILAF